MECMEARALKSSFSTELAMKSAQTQSICFSTELAMKSAQTQSIFEDIWCVTTGLQSDDFSIVDEFFDLPNEDNVIDGSTFLEEEEEHKNSSLSLSSQDPIDDSNSNSTSFSPGLAIPDDDIQELELWSHLMNDSVPEPTLACPKPILEPKTGFTFVNRYETVFHKPVQVHARGVPFIPSAVPVKPRTKRSRSAGNRFWGLASPESSSSSTTSSSPVSTTFWFSSTKIKTPQAISDVGGLFAAGFSKPAAKRPKRKLDDNNTPVQRRCTHCQVTKTPQWRAGPNGPKTLCNACGVRFKSGRLFPEYRPACSPTFSSEVHSNSHRKVLEMRKKKEGGGTTTTKLSPSSSSVTGSTSMILAA